MTLSDFMRMAKKKDADISALIGCSRPTVSKIRRGKLTPSLALASKLAQATNNAVTPNDFLPDREASACQ